MNKDVKKQKAIVLSGLFDKFKQKLKYENIRADIDVDGKCIISYVKDLEDYELWSSYWDSYVVEI